MVMVIHKWFFPIFTIVAVAGFFFSNNTSISPIGAILATLLTLIGISITERLDKIIRQNEEMIEGIDNQVIQNA